MAFNIKLRQIRLRSGYSTEEFADITGVTTQTIYEWENGVKYPPKEKIWLISELFNIPVDELTGNIPSQKTQPVNDKKDETDVRCHISLKQTCSSEFGCADHGKTDYIVYGDNKCSQFKKGRKPISLIKNNNDSKYKELFINKKCPDINKEGVCPPCIKDNTDIKIPYKLFTNKGNYQNKYNAFEDENLRSITKELLIQLLKLLLDIGIFMAFIYFLFVIVVIVMR